MPTAFDNWVEGFYAYVAGDPNDRVELGIDERLGELPDPSLAAQRSRVGEAQRLRQELDALPAAEGFDETLDRDLAALQLDRAIHLGQYTFNGLPRLAQTPQAGSGLGDPILMLLIRDPRPAGERLADITARLEQTPAYLDAMLARLERPVDRWRSMDLGQLAGLPQLFQAVTDLALQENWADSSRLATARTAAETAITRYCEGLKALPAAPGLAVGTETAQRIVDLRGIGMSLSELHTMARTFLADIDQELDALADRLAPRYGLPADVGHAQLQELLSQRFALKIQGDPVQAVLDRYNDERGRILSFIDQHQLFPIPASHAMDVMQTPAFLEAVIPAGAMVPPPPFRAGVRRSIVYLTLGPDRVAEHDELSIPTMMIHEGIPGHHLQLAHAASHPSVIRRQFDSAAHAEGWTTRLEDYMLDRGYMGELTDEGRFCAKREIARIGARVAIDCFFMTGDAGYLDVGVDCDVSAADPFEAAGALLSAVTGFSPERVLGELSWYSLERGYPLSYLAGNRAVAALEAELKASPTNTLDDLALEREFHRVYLKSGNMPLSMLRRVFVNEGLLPA
ncbi:MAG: hypothetical protein ACI9WU_005034 [Myxococcota bacterium]|jgi:hypothetical protein